MQYPSAGELQRRSTTFLYVFKIKLNPVLLYKLSNIKNDLLKTNIDATLQINNDKETSTSNINI